MLGYLVKFIKSFDFYGETISFEIKDGESKYTTLLGTIVTLAILVITFSYSYKQILVLKGFEETSHLYIVEPFVNALKTFDQIRFNTFAY